MARLRTTIAAALAVSLLAAAPAPAEARSRVLKVALPSPGDVTLMHVNYTRAVARKRRLPRFMRLPASARRLLRRNRVAVVGSSVRVSRTRVVGTVVLLRPKGGRRAAATRARSLRVVTDRPVASIVTQRDVLRRRAPRRAGASAEEAYGPACTGETGLFTLLAGDTIPQGNWSFGLYYNDWDHLTEVESADWNRLAAELGYGLYCDAFEPDLSRLLEGLGSQFPVNCTFTTTFIGAATDSEGNVLNDPAFLFDFRCDRPVQSFGITLDDLQVRDCKDAAGNVCRVFSTRSPSDTAVFLTPVPANESWSFQIEGEPPLQRGSLYDIEIEVPQGDVVVEHQVM